ncbi:MAG: glycosyl transferase family 1 [Candidatus Roseilinea sp.]|nr:MAG: glycosyl transferase family 1 [Candidatus Roseilinea sp.]
MLMPKLRLAVVTTHPPGKGSLNEYAYHFVRFLRQKEEIGEIILLPDQLPPDQTYCFEARPGLAPVSVIPCWSFGAHDNAWRIRAAVRQANPDAVLFNIQFASFGSSKVSATLGLTAPYWVKRTGYPTLVLLHNIMETTNLRSAGFSRNPFIESFIRFFGTQVTRLLLTADLVAVTIPKYVEILEAKYKATNVVLAPHGAFEDTPQPSFDLPPGPIKILAFGKFGTYKRVETLIEAFKLLQDGSRPPLELVIAGTNSPNAPGYLESVRQRYADIPNIRYTGYVAEQDIPRIFSEAAVVVFPYNSTTGSSGVLHQSGDYGKAVVLPYIGDLAEVIAEEGYSGEFFAPGDAHSLAAAIARVIDNPARRRELGRQNWIASRGLPIAEVVDWYLLHLEILIKQRQGDAARRLPAT